MSSVVVNAARFLNAFNRTVEKSDEVFRSSSLVKGGGGEGGKEITTQRLKHMAPFKFHHDAFCTSLPPGRSSHMEWPGEKRQLQGPQR